MAINHNSSTILGSVNAQGSVNAVRGWQASLLRVASVEIRGLFMCLGDWCALIMKRTPATAYAVATTATCRISSDRRHQRHQRWMSGVVVGPGTVGVA